ncbi:hypothetical protein LCGC14_0750670 [marine sediment metagenome]|uniref:Uncharacterized protein n=1 Tax=marine sediment metagenome TaxID=412755 RepID=A0A0F9Q431_9ZZZZ
MLKHSLEEYKKRKVIPTRLKYGDYYRSNSKGKSTDFTKKTTDFTKKTTVKKRKHG